MTNRRNFLATTGSVLVGTAGCLGTSNSGDDNDRLPPDDDPRDGYPPSFTETPQERAIDTSTFGTTTVEGIDVPLAPIDATYYWYRRRDARFVDARGQAQYEQSRVYGAVLSPAPAGTESDPVSTWPAGDRIVCYCGCPHHLSSIRAANLIANGYEEVYVIDEGFWEWQDRGYPMAGADVTNQPAAYLVRGRTNPIYAGSTAWAWHEPTGQREATAIDSEGRFELELRFVDVSPTSVIGLRTPEYTLHSPVRELTTGVVTAPPNEPR